MPITWASFEYGLSISRSLASICRCRSGSFISPSPVNLFIPRTSSERVVAVMKSTPFFLNFSIGSGVCQMRESSIRMSLLVRSGFCSEPESANSFAMILLVVTNHE